MCKTLVITLALGALTLAATLSRSAEWYEGGTTHRATLGPGAHVNYRNCLTTSADLEVTARKGSLNSLSEPRDHVGQFKARLCEASVEQSPNSKRGAQAAASGTRSLNVLPYFGPILLFVAAVGTFIINQYVSRRSRLNDRWHDIIGDCVQNPRFIDINFTEKYYEEMDENVRLSYEAFCYKAWGFVQDVVSRRSGKVRLDHHYGPKLVWVTNYHNTWLYRNPEYFTSRRFWTVVNELIKTPQMVMRHKPLPQKDDEVYWEKIYDDFHHHILGPLAPEMIASDDGGKSRNPLVDQLRAWADSGALQDKRIADLGCGPGNLIPCLKRPIGSLTGIDRSEMALKLASQKAREREIAFRPISEDLTNLISRDDLQFDIVIAINSILPRDRRDVSRILNGIHNIMKDDGEFLAIMPSFDTITDHLLRLWRNYYKSRNFGAEHVDRCIEAIVKAKRVDYDNLSFADDGVSSQCYHTLERMNDEFRDAGLEITHFEKVYYPWEMTKKFDYGYFPNAEEEIWDWYVRAKKIDRPRSESSSASM